MLEWNDLSNCRFGSHSAHIKLTAGQFEICYDFFFGHFVDARWQHWCRACTTFFAHNQRETSNVSKANRQHFVSITSEVSTISIFPHFKMPDRLTQLQDTVNLVSTFVYLAVSRLLTFQYIFLFFVDYSKRNTFATALVFYSNVRCRVNFPALNELACSIQIKRHKKIMHNYFPHSYRGKPLLHQWQ